MSTGISVDEVLAFQKQGGTRSGRPRGEQPSGRRNRRERPTLVALEERCLLAADVSVVSGVSRGLAVSSLAASHSGDSPFSPPEPTDQTFVIDTGPGLDTGATDRSGGPLVIDLTIDRWIGDLQKLLSHGLVPTTVSLSLPAYDVDVNGVPSDPSTPPEVDRVTFIESNGTEHVLGTLDGDNGIWQINTFSIDTAWLDFGSYSDTSGYDPGENRLRIDIDTASPPGQDNWVTAIDWVSFQIQAPDPVLFVHGILSGSSTWGQPYLDVWDVYGIPIGLADLGNLDSIQANAGKIDTLYQQMRSRWTTGNYASDRILQVNLVGHSKGGLDSRELIEQVDYVDRLVQVGTPNGGSPLADAIQAAIYRIPVVGIPAGVIGALAAPAGYQLTTFYMALYNATHGSNSNVEYSSVAGDYTYGGFFGSIADAALSVFYGGPSDLIVPVDSVAAFSPPSLFSVYSSSGSNTQARHFGAGAMTASPDIAGTYVIPRLLPTTSRGSGSGSPVLIAGNATQAPGAPIPLTVAPPPSSSGSNPPPEFGAVRQGETQERRVTIDNTAGSTYFGLMYADSDLDLVLVSPSGRLIDPAVAATDPKIDYGKDGSTSQNRSIFYRLAPGAEVGVWTLRIKGTTVTNASGQELYMTLVEQEKGSIRLSVATDAPSYTTGTPVVVRAALVNGVQPISGATVTAYLKVDTSNTLTLSLHDDGAGGDQTAGDGVYSGTINQTIAPGAYVLSVRATGQGASPFDREAGTLVVVGSNGATLQTQSMTSQGVDANGNGLFDTLAVGFDVPATVGGRYVVNAELVDAAGQPIQSVSRAMDLAVGANTATFDFDGRSIYNHGVDGPYTVRAVTLKEDVSGILVPIGAPAGPFTTTTFAFEEFEHDPIRLTGAGGAETTDDDQDGMFDTLTVSLDVDVDLGGSYQWSGELVGAGGQVAARASKTGTLTTGVNTIRLDFDGREIGNSGWDGPYSVHNLVLIGPGGSVLTNSQVQTQAYKATQFESDRPVFTPVLVQVIDEGRPLALTTHAVSPRTGVTLTYSLVSPPPGASINPSTGVISWTPSEAQGPATYNLTVLATDSGSPILSGTQVVTVNVREVNQAPVLAPIGDRATNEGTTLRFNVTATDPDQPANRLTYRLVSPPPGALIDQTTGALTFAPGGGPGSYQITVQVIDDGSPPLSTTRTFTVLVNNVAPVVEAVPDVKVSLGDAFTRTVRFDDPGAGAWSATVDYGDGSGPLPVAVSGSRELALNHTYLAQGSYTVVLRVRDSSGAEGHRQFVVVVGPPTTSSDVVGPSVVDLWRVGIHFQPTTILVQFNEPLEPTGAQDVRNYQLRDAGRDRRWGTRDDLIYRIGSATYDPAALTVTLRPRRRLRFSQTHELLIRGTGPSPVSDPLGNPLGRNGAQQPGADFAVRFTRFGHARTRQVVPSRALLRSFQRASRPDHVSKTPVVHRSLTRVFPARFARRGHVPSALFG